MELVESFKASDISKAILDVGNALLGLTNTDLGNTILQITLLTAAVTALAAAYAEMGADFSNCTTDEEYLAAIEDFELHPPGANQPSIEERTAAALEAQVLRELCGDVWERTSAGYQTTSWKPWPGACSRRYKHISRARRASGSLRRGRRSNKP